MAHFNGFPDDAIVFFEDIAHFNDKVWFEENKSRFQQVVQEPAQAFVTALGERLATFVPGIRYDTKLNGSGSIMRIYRDTRFSKDKTPYKTNLGISWWEGPGKKMEEPGYFFHLDQDGAWFAGGMYAFPKGVLEPYRAAVDNAKSGAALESAIAHAEQAGMTMSGIGEYARVPHGFDADHAYGDLLRKKGLVAISPAITIETVTSPELVDVCLEYAQAILPLHQWLVALPRT